MKRKISKLLLIEGTSNEENGNLRQGFNKLLSQKLKGKMPRIKMANGKTQALKIFKVGKSKNPKYLLIDLDKPESEKDKELLAMDLKDNANNVSFMIQEMETWFLSQPDILDKYFETSIFTKKIKRPPKEIANPAEFLQNISKKTKKKGYHKVQDGTALLILLDANKLERDFLEFRSLIEKLS